MAKKLSRRTVITISCICAAVIILSIALPIGIIFGKKTTTPEPYFDSFNDETDYYIRAKWNKIRDAGLYECQYCYGDPTDDGSSVVDVQTTNTSCTFRRHKGKVAFRVKARIAGENTQYSDWIYLDVSAWKLQAPIVTISDTLSMSWVASSYKVDDSVVTVTGYEYRMFIAGKELVNLPKYSDTTYLAAKKYIKNYIDDNLSDIVAESALGGEWTDFDLELHVRAVTYTMFAGTKITSPTGNEVILDAIYEDSDFGVGVKTITKEIYDQLAE